MTGRPAILLTLLCVAAAAADSPRFRGAAGDGVAASDAVAVPRSKEDHLWRTPTADAGWSSPAVAEGRIWLTAARVTPASEEEKARKLAGVKFAQIKDVVGSATLSVVCLDLATGETIIDRELTTVTDPSPVHPMNSFASPTCAVSGGRVVAHFGRYGTWCLDAATGQTLWTRAIDIDDSVGPGSSPVVHEGVVLIVSDGVDRQFVSGLSLADGSVLWQTPRPPMGDRNGEFKKAYSTPLLIEVGGATQAVIPGSVWCCAYGPADGRELWRVRHGDGYSVTPMATYAAGLVAFATGYGETEILAVDPTGRGDVTATHVRWRQSKGAPAKPSLVSDGTLLYVAADDGVLTALRAADGSVVYRKRLGGQFSASPLLSGGRVFVGNHDGELFVFRTGETYEEVARVDFGEQIMASPVAVGDDLLVRTKAAVYRFTP